MRYLLIIITLLTAVHVFAQDKEVDSLNRPLIISNTELEFTINFLNKPIATRTITISAKKNVTIKSITKGPYIKLSINSKLVTLPFTIKANTSVPLKIIVAPSPVNYQAHDTLTFFTTESNTPYSIYSNIEAHHFDLKSIRALRSLETLWSVKLSKSKDKYLILPSNGSISYAAITSFSGEVVEYSIEGTTKIDLSVFPVGSYRLYVSGSDGGGDWHEEGQVFLNITN